MTETAKPDWADEEVERLMNDFAIQIEGAVGTYELNALTRSLRTVASRHEALGVVKGLRMAVEIARRQTVIPPAEEDGDAFEAGWTWAAEAVIEDVMARADELEKASG